MRHWQAEIVAPRWTLILPNSDDQHATWLDILFTNSQNVLLNVGPKIKAVMQL